MEAMGFLPVQRIKKEKHKVQTENSLKTRALKTVKNHTEVHFVVLIHKLMMLTLTKTILYIDF